MTTAWVTSPLSPILFSCSINYMGSKGIIFFYRGLSLSVSVCHYISLVINSNKKVSQKQNKVSGDLPVIPSNYSPTFTISNLSFFKKNIKVILKRTCISVSNSDSLVSSQSPFESLSCRERMFPATPLFKHLPRSPKV